VTNEARDLHDAAASAGRQPWQTYVEDREAILLADKLGYSEALVGEHVTDLAENVTSCLMFLASLAHETKQIVLGTGTVNMPNSHPAGRSPRRWRCSTTCSKGRFIFGISPGGLMSDAEVFGNFKKDRNAIFLESINMVLDIWRREAPYNRPGQFFNVTTENTKILEIGQGRIIKPLPEAASADRGDRGGAAFQRRDRGRRSAAGRRSPPNFLLPSGWPRIGRKYQEGCDSINKKAKVPIGACQIDLRRGR
jgi:alkanesulfonate monooxygenase SsuD/methylene tetrahydromethanopterin reductase-like flavin-dependent oxidoreductase (luciferase family)